MRYVTIVDVRRLKVKLQYEESKTKQMRLLLHVNVFGIKMKILHLSNISI